MSLPLLRGTVTPVRSPDRAPELVVLGPSLGTTTALWDAVANDLAADHRVLRYDLPGHGSSPAASQPFTVADLADAVIDLVDSVGGGPFAYAGISAGGAVGLELALRHPQRISSLAVICSAARIGSPEGWRERAERARSSGTASLVALSAERWFAPGFLDAHPAVGAPALTALLDVDDVSYALVCEALADFDARDAARDIRVPTLCAAGESDVATPPTQLEALAASIPGATYRLIEGAAHLPAIERPDVVASLLRSRLGGMRVRREVLGDAHVDRASAGITAETADFQNFITRYAWGEIWSRPTLARRDRSLLTLAALITGNHQHELAMHVRAALTNGLSRDEIAEAIMHTAVYAGVPAANSAFETAKRVFAELDD
ncbi:4-carboxymuconolactone decarboxylase [Conyzicola sp.]|uniref:bifunctional 3-oxoadipate enol-lactonase/4-carboxymuconolactone decarboxylase PcaDC n=1 Tax=Conyzicola sp. TaxID=1969404 RepID=UPI00398A1CDF